MARKPRARLAPIATLSPYEQSRRRFARSIGMDDERQLDRFLQKNNLRDDAPQELINVRYRRSKHAKLPWQEVISKYHMVVDVAHRMSPFVFQEKYKKLIEQALNDPNISKYGKTKLRKFLRELNARTTMQVGELIGKNGQYLLL